MNTTAALEAEAAKYKSEIAKIFEVQRFVAAKQPIPMQLAAAARVLANRGHLRWSDRAGRWMFTPEGQKFAAQSRKYGRRLGH